MHAYHDYINALKRQYYFGKFGAIALAAFGAGALLSACSHPTSAHSTTTAIVGAMAMLSAVLFALHAARCRLAAFKFDAETP